MNYKLYHGKNVQKRHKTHINTFVGMCAINRKWFGIRKVYTLRSRQSLTCMEMNIQLLGMHKTGWRYSKSTSMKSPRNVGMPTDGLHDPAKPYGARSYFKNRINILKVQKCTVNSQPGSNTGRLGYLPDLFCQRDLECRKLGSRRHVTA